METIKRRVLIEVNHPGQVHLIKNLYFELIGNGHFVIVTTKKNHSIELLLEKYGIPYQIIGRKGNNVITKLINQFIHDFNALKIAKRNKIEIGVGSSITNDHLSFFSKLNSIHLSDDDEEVVPFVSKFSYPFADVILAPDCTKFTKSGSKVLGYAGYHELAYLHPSRFQPDESVINKYGIHTDEKFFVLRFVALKGHHDAGHKGISLEQKRTLISLLLQKGKVFITTEKPIEPEFEQYRIPVSPEKIHHFLYYATMFLGDSQTMSSEAAIIGTPALKCNTFAGKLSVPNELEKKYNLCFSYHPDNFGEFLEKTKELLNQPNLKASWKQRQALLLKEKIDVTAFFTWFIENYPESAKIMKENPNYQYSFK
jgi:hypothetical protein